MSIFNEFLSIIDYICEKIEIPCIKTIHIPKNKTSAKLADKSKFGAIFLEDGTVGIVFLRLIDNFPEDLRRMIIKQYINSNPHEILLKIDPKDEILKTIGFGIINAISQYYFKKVKFKFDFSSDGIEELKLNPGDHVGMIGFFPPLVKKIEELKIPLTIIEKKKQMIKKTSNWEVSLNPSKLKSCNKILCTSTTVLNDTIDEILIHTNNAEKFAMIGPTAGFIPDPLFNRKIDLIGGTHVKNSNLFLELLNQNERWSHAIQKYCIYKENYTYVKDTLR